MPHFCKMEWTMEIERPFYLKQLKKMIDILEDNDDVQKVHHNCSVDLEEVE